MLQYIIIIGLEEWAYFIIFHSSRSRGGSTAKILGGFMGRIFPVPDEIRGRNSAEAQVLRKEAITIEEIVMVLNRGPGGVDVLTERGTVHFLPWGLAQELGLTRD